MEDTSALYMAKIRSQIDYANARGVEVGGYDLIDLDRARLGYAEEAIAADGTQSSSACFASQWVDKLAPMVLAKVEATGLSMVETDGPYGGQACAAENHTHHRGLADAVYWQTRLQSEFFKELRSRGVFTNAPDHYFSAGSNKMMFYGDPTNFGKPRRMDLLLSRQMLYDRCGNSVLVDATSLFETCVHPASTFEWLPTQGWSLVPLENYGGGGVEAAFSPLEANLRDYDLAWAMYMGYGVSGVCWRGKRIFEGDASKAVVQKWISFYKKYRGTLAGSKSVDAVLHANPIGGPTKEKAILFAFNPTTSDIEVNITVDLYYTGLTKNAIISLEDNSSGTFNAELRRDYTVTVQAKIVANGYSWWAIRGT